MDNIQTWDYSFFNPLPSPCTVTCCLGTHSLTQLFCVKASLFISFKFGSLNCMFLYSCTMKKVCLGGGNLLLEVSDFTFLSWFLILHLFISASPICPTQRISLLLGSSLVPSLAWFHTTSPVACSMMQWGSISVPLLPSNDKYTFIIGEMVRKLQLPFFLLSRTYRFMLITFAGW